MTTRNGYIVVPLTLLRWWWLNLSNPFLRNNTPSRLAHLQSGTEGKDCSYVKSPLRHCALGCAHQTAPVSFALYSVLYGSRIKVFIWDSCIFFPYPASANATIFFFSHETSLTQMKNIYSLLQAGHLSAFTPPWHVLSHPLIFPHVATVNGISILPPVLFLCKKSIIIRGIGQGKSSTWQAILSQVPIFCCPFSSTHTHKAPQLFLHRLAWRSPRMSLPPLFLSQSLEINSLKTTNTLQVLIC